MLATDYSFIQSAGEAAVHLLGRMLAFDPGRRISAEEALSHEYFAALESSAVSDLGEFPFQNPSIVAGPFTPGSLGFMFLCIMHWCPLSWHLLPLTSTA